MNREEILADVMAIQNRNIILELATGAGKTLCALKRIEKALEEESNPNFKALIVIPKLVLKKTWQDEIKKWNLEYLLERIEFSTYISLPKNYDGFWSIICFDEAHHLSERCFRSIDSSFNRYIVKHLFLSATLSYNFKAILFNTFPDLYLYNISLKTAIDNKILPDPVILLYPMILDNSEQKYEYVKRQSGKKVIVTYQARWPIIKRMTKDDLSPHILCTEQQYYNLLDDDIKFLSGKHKAQGIVKQKRIARLKILANFKTDKVKDILSMLKDYRTITFCESIEQTQQLGKNCIHSKNIKRLDVLEDFNNKKIKHITSCEILSEGVNVTDCRVGIFARINSSDLQIKQKLGRVLRHKSPVVILPYYKNTREEQIVNENILPDFNPEKVFTITGINEILKYLK